ncbi:hypothetical protein AVEN_132897-1 [Araneus ventricosus]|uniref:Uncharacterized protein n=1 Tax=Araneus ventricosus TaxID=182803 RepID=A0A4Y2IR53_ARAVE|nr:hypothetical protein AVEN_132897-1 [Araneus ventricosus]
MRTTPEIRMALHCRCKVCQETAALIIFHKSTFYLKKATNTTQLALGRSINSTSHVYVQMPQLKLALAVVEVMFREMCSRSFLPLVCLVSSSIRG